MAGFGAPGRGEIDDGAAGAGDGAAGLDPRSKRLGPGGGSGAGDAAGAVERGKAIPWGITWENAFIRCQRQYGKDLVDATEIPAARQQTKMAVSGRPALDFRKRSETIAPSTPRTAPIAPTGTATSPSQGTQQTTQAMIPSAREAMPRALCDLATGMR
jgi:hypothetical protein